MPRRFYLAALVLCAVGLSGCGWRPGWSRAEPKATVRAYIVHHGERAFREIAANFERETGIHVDIAFSCRRGLYGVVSKNRDGDLCISSQRSVLERLQEDGLARGERILIGHVVPVIEVDKGNPKKIWTLADLARPGVRVALAKEPGCMGKVARAILEKNGLAQKVEPNVVKRVLGHSNTAASVDGGDVDATIMWLWAVRELPGDRVEAVPIPPGQNVIEPVEALVLNTGGNAEGAEQFAAYLQCPKSREILRREGLLGVD